MFFHNFYIGNNLVASGSLPIILMVGDEIDVHMNGNDITVEILSIRMRAEIVKKDINFFSWECTCAII